MTERKTIESARLRLRPFQAEDVDDRYVQWLNDPHINQFLESRFAEHTLESVRAYVASLWDDPTSRLYAIEAEGRHIGNIKLGAINLHHQHANIGLFIGDRQSWGKGYATEAIQALTEHAVDMGLKKIIAGAYSVNPASVRAFERAGYLVEGRQVAQYSCQGKRVDCILLGYVAD